MNIICIAMQRRKICIAIAKIWPWTQKMQDPILWIRIPSSVQDEAGTAFDPRFVQHYFYSQQCVHCTVKYSAQYTAQCTVIRQSIVPLRWASVPLRWAQQRVKRSSHPQKVPMMIKVNEMTMTTISRPSLFRLVAYYSVYIDCIKADDDIDGVTLKDYEVEESGEYADCYHKTTQNCTFHLVLWCTMRSCDLYVCFIWFCDMWLGNVVTLLVHIVHCTVCHIVAILHGTDCKYTTICGTYIVSIDVHHGTETCARCGTWFRGCYRIECCVKDP